MTALEWLPTQADPGFAPSAFPGFPPDDPALAGLTRDPDLAAFLQARNGLYAFARALHVFGLDATLPYHDLRVRNAGAWREAYGSAAQGLAFFAEDVFGHLYALRDGAAVSFDPETAKVETVGRGFDGWAAYLAGDLAYATGGGIAQAWTQSHGPIPYEQRLSPLKPFFLGGEYALGNLRAADWDRNLAFLAGIHRQVKDLPEGTAVRIQS